MKKLYYTVDKESTDGIEFNGNKTVTVYDMVNNEPKLFTVIDCTLEDTCKEVIQNYLNDNGHGDETFELILL